MIKIESSSSSNKKSKRVRTTTVTFVLAFSVAAFVASGVWAKPPPPINATVCATIGGTWTPNTCTIPAGTGGEANQPFTISKGVTLDVQGSLTIPTGVTITNAKDGTIIVENAGGVSTPFDDPVWRAGILVLGTLDNSGTIIIKNETANTEGITVSVSVSENDPPEPNPFAVVPGTLTNSGTITIQNRDQTTRGIKNLGTIANSHSGTITVANRVADSVGIYNRRSDHIPLGSNYYYINGAMTNAGSITISNSGDSSGWGVYNVGLFTNSAKGTFTINPSPASDDAGSGGFYNKGSITSHGTFTNNRGTVESLYGPTPIWGSYNEDPGTMINYGTTFVDADGALDSPDFKGTFYNNSVMINLGHITSHGVLFDESAGATMINFGTIYNYGGIGNGTNKGICVDETSTNPAAGGC